MNGEEIPGLMDGIREWIGKNRDPETGLVFGTTVREPVEEHTVKTYAFTLDDSEKPFVLYVWEFGNVFIEQANFTKDLNAPDEEIIYNENFEFSEAKPLIAKIESFMRENVPLA